MIAYGASKAAVHHMNLSISGENGGLAEGNTSLCLAPVVLDTPMNRKFMSNADFRSVITRCDLPVRPVISRKLNLK